MGSSSRHISLGSRRDCVGTSSWLTVTMNGLEVWRGMCLLAVALLFSLGDMAALRATTWPQRSVKQVMISSCSMAQIFLSLKLMLTNASVPPADTRRTPSCRRFASSAMVNFSPPSVAYQVVSSMRKFATWAHRLQLARGAHQGCAVLSTCLRSNCLLSLLVVSTMGANR